MSSLRSASLLLVLAFVGCSGAETAHNEVVRTADPVAKAVTRENQKRIPTPPAAPAPGMRGGMGGMAGMMGVMNIAVTDGAVAVQLGDTSTSAAPAGISRKIIYDAQVDLVAESVDPITKKVGALVQEARGYIAEQNVTGSPGVQRSMRWRIRIPVEQFESFVDSIVSLGELERNNRTSQDITEQYVDIEARIKNKKVEEQTLQKILQERSGKLEDVLKIEIELSRVRGEIEQLEGKIRVLENLSSLATMTLNVREREKFAPPPPAVADFSTKIARAWEGSLLDLANIGKSLVLWAVSWAIWVPFLLVGAVLAWVLARWLIRYLVRIRPAVIALARTPIIPPRTPTTSE
jgi:hypothetical protein